jgi:hypothetical protein
VAKHAQARQWAAVDRPTSCEAEHITQMFSNRSVNLFRTSPGNENNMIPAIPLCVVQAIVVFHNSLTETNLASYWEVATTSASDQTFESLPGKAGALTLFGYRGAI